MAQYFCPYSAYDSKNYIHTSALLILKDVNIIHSTWAPHYHECCIYTTPWFKRKKQMVAVFLCSLPTGCSVNDFASVHLKWVWALSELQACDFFLSMVEFWTVCVWMQQWSVFQIVLFRRSQSQRNHVHYWSVSVFNVPKGPNNMTTAPAGVMCRLPSTVVPIMCMLLSSVPCIQKYYLS